MGNPVKRSFIILMPITTTTANTARSPHEAHMTSSDATTQYAKSSNQRYAEPSQEILTCASSAQLGERFITLMPITTTTAKTARSPHEAHMTSSDSTTRCR
jgi:hypothetical protein